MVVTKTSVGSSAFGFVVVTKTSTGSSSFGLAVVVGTTSEIRRRMSNEARDRSSSIEGGLIIRTMSLSSMKLGVGKELRDFPK
jgi:hypothetical protein